MSYSHLNQFHQPDGSAWGGPGYQWSHGDCWATSGAMAADWSTDGAKTPGPPRIRELSGNTQLSGNVGDIKAALDQLGIVSHIPSGGASWDTIEARLATGRWAVCIATDYDRIPDDLSCQPSFDGDHMLFLPPGVPDPKGRIDGDDPLCENTRKYPTDVIHAAARKCATHLGVPRLIVLFVRHQKTVADPPPDNQCADLKDQIAELQDRIATALADLSGSSQS